MAIAPYLLAEEQAQNAYFAKQNAARAAAAKAAAQRQAAIAAYVNYQDNATPTTYEIANVYSPTGTFTGYKTTGSIPVSNPNSTANKLQAAAIASTKAAAVAQAAAVTSGTTSHPATSAEPSGSAVVQRTQVSPASSLPSNLQSITTHPTTPAFVRPPGGGGSGTTSSGSSTTSPPVSTGSSGSSTTSSGSPTTYSSPGEIHSGVASPSWSAASLTTEQWAIIIAIIGVGILLLVLVLG